MEGPAASSSAVFGRDATHAGNTTVYCFGKAMSRKWNADMLVFLTEPKQQ